MKKLLLPLVIASAVLFTACSDKKDQTDREMVLLTDSSYNNGLLSDTAAMEKIAPVAQAPEVAAPPVRTTTPAVRPAKPKYNQPVYDNNQTTTAPVVTPTPVPQTEPAPTTGTETAGNETAGTETAPAPIPAKKKGISNSAKGAIIGGVGGAVAGAVIGKNGKGAIIGGVIGAAGGYILGKKKDNKTADTTVN